MSGVSGVGTSRLYYGGACCRPTGNAFARMATRSGLFGKQYSVSPSALAKRVAAQPVPGLALRPSSSVIMLNAPF